MTKKFFKSFKNRLGIELIPYIGWNCGNNKCYRERKVQHIKRENIHTVLFRQF